MDEIDVLLSRLETLLNNPHTLPAQLENLADECAALRYRLNDIITTAHKKAAALRCRDTPW